MPTSQCRYPDHHSGPSAGPPVTLLLAIMAGAAVVAYARTVIVVLAVVLVVGIIAAAVMMLIHSAHAAPYDAAIEQDTSQSAPRLLQASQSQPVATTVVHVHQAPADGRTAALEAEVAALRAQAARQIEAPAQHIHLHGISVDEVAELVHRRAIED